MSQPAFVTTHWTRVLEARGDSTEARAALSDLCAIYYAPVFTFIRVRSTDDDSARDLTQEFFARILSGNGISSIDPGYGRFRSFLLGAVKHFLSDMRDEGQRLKRGGGAIVVPLETLPSNSDTDTSLDMQLADSGVASPDREFDRKWALTLLDRALDLLAREKARAGQSAEFNALKPWLTGDAEKLLQSEAAQRLHMNEGALRVAVHRLRRQFRQIIKSEIAQTLNDPAQVNEELAHLLAALG